MHEQNIKLGLKENWQQFSWLVLINVFVGGMVGMERTILPELASSEFDIAASTAILSFIVIFGITKSLANYFMGRLADRFGRRNLLIVGWIFALPVPLIMIYADRWEWIILSNILLGINQGLCWSSTVVMKIDLVGDKDRGLAMGINEAAGYLAVGVVAFLTGWLASQYSLRPYPFYLGIVMSVLGLLFSIFMVKDTHHHVKVESTASETPLLNRIFWETSWKNPNLGAVSQAGLVNNLNDGMIWGLFPIFLSGLGFTLSQIGIIVSIYPTIWGIGQLVTGKIADHIDVKKLLGWGMLLQGIVIIGFIVAESMLQFISLSVLLGIGTALVYPTFLVAIARYSHPSQRSECVGVFRLWRDLGYAIGAIISGVLADTFGILFAIAFIGMTTVFSSMVIFYRMNSV